MDSFVIDTNIIFSSLLKDSTARKIILSDAFNLFAPEFLFTEIKKYEKTILKKSGLRKENFDLLLLLLQSHIAVIPFNEFSGYLTEAEGLKNYFQLLLAVVNGEEYKAYLEKVPEELKELFEKIAPGKAK
jgi:predicted nucleic acid-binding protein